MSVYEISENAFAKLKILEFNSPNSAWLYFVADNRKSIYAGENYDIVVGPVANDNTMPVLNLYILGFLDEEETKKRLLPQKLKDQYVFKTDESLQYLKFKEAKSCEK